MKIVLLAALHSRQDFDVPLGDLLIVAGDLTHLGSFKELKRSTEWIKSLPHEFKVVIGSNHDIWAENIMNSGYEQRLRMMLNPIIYLRDSSVEIQGLHLYGTPWVLPWAGAFNLPSDELKKKWDAIPVDTNVLVCHQPPAGLLDAGRGCQHLHRTVQRLPKLRLCVYGHVHEAAGMEYRDGVLFCNAAQKAFTTELS